MSAINDRLRTYTREYAQAVWPDLTYRDPTDDECLTMEIRSDWAANAHVEGEHNSNGICTYDSARECGERMVAAEYVECTDMRS